MEYLLVLALLAVLLGWGTLTVFGPGIVTP